MAEKKGPVLGKDVIPLERRERERQKGQLGFLGWDVKNHDSQEGHASAVR